MKTVPFESVLTDAVAGYWGQEAGTSDADVLVIRNGDVQTEGVRWANLPLRGFKAREVDRSIVSEGDILLTTSGDCGRAAMVEDEPASATCASNFVRVLRFNRDVAPRYAYHYMRTNAFRSSMARYTRGAVMQNLSIKPAFAATAFPLLPLDEQRRIAALLDAADAVRAKRRQILAHLDALPQAIFREVFGDVSATSTVEAEASKIRTGPFGSQLLHSEFVAEGIAVIGLDNVVGNEFRWVGRRYITLEKYEQLKRYTVAPGDVLISIMGTTGRCVVVPEDIPVAINTKHICAITPARTLTPAFLRASFLWHPEALAHLRRQTKGSIMDGLNMGIIKAMPVPVPPLAEQAQFSQRVEAVARQRTAVERALAADDELFASLQFRAFRGEV